MVGLCDFAMFGESNKPLPEDIFTPQVLLNEPYIIEELYEDVDIYEAYEPVVKLDPTSDPVAGYSAFIEDFPTKSVITISVTDVTMIGAYRNLVLRIEDSSTR